jgi:hypothetical protein
VNISEMEARGSKTLVATEPTTEPSWLVWTVMKGFRVVLLTVLWAGLGMGVGLFCGIVGVLVLSLVQHRALDLSLAYRNIATLVAILIGGCAFLWNALRMIQETVRRARARKA